jgi:hypothetical protein
MLFQRIDDWFGSDMSGQRLELVANPSQGLSLRRTSSSFMQRNRRFLVFACLFHSADDIRLEILPCVGQFPNAFRPCARYSRYARRVACLSRLDRRVGSSRDASCALTGRIQARLRPVAGLLRRLVRRSSLAPGRTPFSSHHVCSFPSFTQDCTPLRSLIRAYSSHQYRKA